MSRSRKKADEMAAAEAAAGTNSVGEESANPDAGGDAGGMNGEFDEIADREAVEAPLDALEAMRVERDAFQEKWLRAVAEMENVRKRARRDVQDSRRFAQADLLRPLLDVHDNFERALQSLPSDEDTAGGARIREGVELIFQKFRSVLKENGVEAIAALDTEFDPKVHEAVGQMEREGAEPGTVIEVVQPGYVLGVDFVLRPARVIVAG